MKRILLIAGTATLLLSACGNEDNKTPGQHLDAAIDSTKEFGKEAVEATGKAATKLGEDVKAGTQSAAHEIEAGVKQLDKDAKQAGAEVKEGAKNLANDAKQAGKEAAAGVKEVGKDLKDGTKAAGKEIKEGAINTKEAVKEAIRKN